MNELRNRGPIRGVGEVLARRDNGLWQVKMVNVTLVGTVEQKAKSSWQKMEAMDSLLVEVVVKT